MIVQVPRSTPAWDTSDYFERCRQLYNTDSGQIQPTAFESNEV